MHKVPFIHFGLILAELRWSPCENTLPILICRGDSFFNLFGNSFLGHCSHRGGWHRVRRVRAIERSTERLSEQPSDRVIKRPIDRLSGPTILGSCGSVSSIDVLGSSLRKPVSGWGTTSGDDGAGKDGDGIRSRDEVANTWPILLRCHGRSP